MRLGTEDEDDSVSGIKPFMLETERRLESEERLEEVVDGVDAVDVLAGLSRLSTRGEAARDLMGSCIMFRPSNDTEAGSWPVGSMGNEEGWKHVPRAACLRRGGI